MDYNLELQNIKEWAKKLLIVQYSQAKKNKALIDLLVEILFANNLILQIRDLCLNVEESIGAQLDVVGKWAGIDRYYNAIDLWDHPYTALVNYSNISSDTYEQWQGGFSTYSNFADNDGGFLTYSTWKETRTQINKMGDDYFRQLIKLKIIKNSINCTCKSIDDAITKWSEGQVYTTWGVMEVTYHYPSSYSNLMALALYKNVLPVPTGCTLLTEVIS